MSMNALAIRNTLRNETSADLERKRKIIILSALGLLDFSIISLYQTGVIKKLPDLPFPIFDSNKVNSSTEAYQMGAPDGPISATVYGLTMILASAGGTKATGRNSAYDLLLGGAIAANTAGALYYLYDMIFKQRKICLYCVTGAAINIASAIIMAPVFSKSFRRVINYRKINIGSIL